MSNELIIRFYHLQPGMDPDLINWVFVDDHGQMGDIHQGSLDEISGQVAGHKIVVIIPGNDVTLSSALVPTQNKKRLMTALPFALEDQLVSDVEDLHFALGGRNDEGETNCAVVDRDKMDNWVAKLKEFGIQANFIIPDILAVPFVNGSWSLLVDENNVLVRTGFQSGFSIETENAEAFLAMLLKENSDTPPERLYVYKYDEGGSALPDLSSLQLEIIEDICVVNLLPLIKGLDLDSAINLLQGAYSRSEQIGKIWRPWWPAAAMFASLVFLQLAMTTTHYFQLKSQSDEIQAEIKQIYLTAFPDAKNVVNPQVQMERKLKALRGGAGQGGSSVLGLLSGTASVLKSTAGLEIKSIRYQDGKLDVDMIIKDLQTLDKLKLQLVQQSGLSVDIVTANSRNNRVESRLKIQNRES
ncbi:MAG: type II secretion system protein GspL [Gammaproteobacteria bacterium]|nr:type II secretion system protein GspL [Gammaproteobacteria bacterium]